MLISRRKRKEGKEINVFLNNKLLEQVTQMKYLWIIIDNKFKFSEHISYAAEKCTKLIHSLSISAKISWGLKHEALKTICKGVVLPLLLYEAPVWIEAMKYEYNRQNISECKDCWTWELLKSSAQCQEKHCVSWQDWLLLLLTLKRQSN